MSTQNIRKLQPIKLLVKRLWGHISSRRRGQFGLLFILMIFSSFAEVLSIGAVLPFLGVLTSPEVIFNHTAMQPIIRLLDLTSSAELLLPITVAFGIAALIAGLMRLLLLWTSIRLSFATGADLSINIYQKTLYQPYSVHCSRNSSEIINSISSKTHQTIHTITMLSTILSSAIMIITIIVALIAIDPMVALGISLSISIVYIIIIRLTRKQLLLNSVRVSDESTQVIKSMQEGLGGIRDILIDGSQKTHIEIYRDADIPLRRALGNNRFLSASPRFGVEAIGMVIIAFFAYSLSQKIGGVASAIPILGAIALGAQRLMPVLQQAYGGWTDIRGGHASLQDTIELLDQKLPEYVSKTEIKPLIFDNSIAFKKISFRYNSNDPYVLKNINFTISKGSRIGFIGTTGSGKSTLLDIVMGLLEPTDGFLEVDGQTISEKNNRSWQKNIAHVPQAIFLADCSIAENIAFGVSKNKIDLVRVSQAAKKAQISDTIESWQEGYSTMVGERGVRLSGGQRQRIGIARALYKEANVIIFDEATSSLDNKTEQEVMQSIGRLSKDLTLLIIAHNMTTLKDCSQIIELDGSGIKRAGDYDDMINNFDT
ncbi:ABC transporter ATP-binding protein/permease [Candidatus Thioglobus sp.]|nr:ABC transporter ATP-binding protein/permease [Candidatus Thioglobus sp.]